MNTASPCFCELAPLYALDILSEQDVRWVEAQVKAFPELAAELAMFQQAVAALPYSSPILPVADRLKAQLFQRIGVALPLETEGELRPPLSTSTISTSAISTSTSPTSTMLNFLNGERLHLPAVHWRPHSIPGIMVALIHRDRSRRELVALMRAEPGVTYPTHHHATAEEIYILAGNLVIGDLVYGSGAYIHSEPGSTHTLTTPAGCMFFIRTSLNDTSLNQP